jgi:hypothetical protein
LANDKRLEIIFYLEKILRYSEKLKQRKKNNNSVQFTRERERVHYCVRSEWSTTWFKYDRDYLCVNKSQFVPLTFKPLCTKHRNHLGTRSIPTAMVLQTWQQVKGKGHPQTGHENPKKKRGYSSTLSSNLTLDRDGWLTPRPGRFNPGKETRYPLYRRLGGPQSRSGRVRKTLPPPVFDPRTVQPVASRRTDRAVNVTTPVITLAVTTYAALSVVTMQNTVLCNVTPYSLVQKYQHFELIYCIHLHRTS